LTVDYRNRHITCANKNYDMRKRSGISKKDTGQSAKQPSGKSGEGSFFPKIKQGKNSFFKPAAVQRKAAAKSVANPVQQQEAHTKITGVQNGQLVQKAMQTTGNRIDASLKQPLSQFLGENIDHVRIHDNAESGQAAESIQAKAFTIGNQIHIGPSGKALSGKAREELLTHEIVHTLQQKNVNPQVQAKMQVSQPGDAHEQHATSIAGDFLRTRSGGYQSQGLGMRNRQRITPVNEPVVHRDIKGYYTMPYGKMELDLTKNNATAAGANAAETGEVRFHPSDTAPESDEIRLVQIVRVIDTSGISTTAGSPWNYAGSAEGDRDSVRTDADVANNVAGGFFVDHSAAIANPRTKAADATVLPYYNAYWGGATGSRRGKTKVAATLWDSPSHNAPVKYNFVTSAKANDTGVWYGTALWGFEIYLDKAGIAKIKNEYKSFRQFQGETTNAALTKFNDFYKNPGTAGAP
jgi:hypothetical protein